MEDHKKGLTEVQVDGISRSSFIHSTEGHQIIQAQFALGEAILAVSNSLYVFRMFQLIFQEDLFCDLSRHGQEADWSVPTVALLLTFFKSRHDVSLF